MSRKHEESWFEKAVSEPAVLLEEGVEGVARLGKEVFTKRPFKVAEEYWNTLGPGLTTGAADDDPSGIATYSQTGAQYGFQLLWLSWFSFPLMAVVQEMCARIGVVTGHGLAANIRHRYPKWTLYMVTSLLFVANTFNIGADLGAMAQGMQLIAPHLDFALLVIFFAFLSLGLQIFTTYARYARYLKYLAFVLFAYIFSAFLSHLDWTAVLHNTVVPHLAFNRSQIYLVCAILGTTISPYLFFWQTSQEVEEENIRRPGRSEDWHPPTSHKELRAIRTDVWSGMFFSNSVMFFIIAACAGTLYTHGITNIATAADAATALKPFAGEGAYLLFAIGIIGTGMLAIPVLAGSTSYAMSESFEWKSGLYRKLKEAYAFYGVIIVSILVGIALNFVGLDPIKALIYSAVANGVVAPVVLFFIVRLASDKKIMTRHVNSRAITITGWLAFGLMVLAGLAALASPFL